eukprot:4724323-Alexandrium_andersonii.AAC.1
MGVEADKAIDKMIGLEAAAADPESGYYLEDTQVMHNLSEQTAEESVREARKVREAETRLRECCNAVRNGLATHSLGGALGCDN